MNRQEAIEAIGRNVRARRERRGLTVAQLAARSGRTSRTVEAIEDGRRMPRMRTLMDLAFVLEVGLDVLLDGIEWVPGEDPA